MNEPLHVLELGSGVSAAYAAKLLGDHGADVVKVETPDGDQTRLRGPFPDGRPDPENSGLFLAINVNKRGICLDLSTTNGREELHRLIQWANILVHNYPADQVQHLGIEYQRLKRIRPDLVVLSLTPFGSVGPYAGFQAEELTVANAGGWSYVCPATHTDPALPPLKVFGSQCALMTGIAGAMAALAVYRDTGRSGVGDYIDLSQQSYVASTLEACVPAYSYMGEVAARFHQRSLIPWRIFQAKDANVFIVCVEQDQWQRLVEFMGNPEWADIELFADQPGRAEHQDLIHHFVQEFVSNWNAMDLYHEAQKHRICVAPVLDLEKFASNEHLRARHFFESVEQKEGQPVEHIASAILTSRGRARIRRPAPELGQHNAEVLESVKPVQTGTTATAGWPLAGVRVVDLTWAWAGPFASMNLAHLGAEVIRLESAVRPDLYRRLPLFPPELSEPTLNCSGMFNQWNQGKASVAVDLRDPRGIEIVKAFVANSDVVIQNFATGVMERLGLGYDELQRINPRIILASISGYGQTGPYREYMGYGPAIPPLTGLSSVTGYVDGEAEEFGLSMPDPTAGITAAWAVVSALANREETGRGEHLDITLWEATGVLAVESWMEYAFNGTQPRRMGNRDPLMSPHGCFPCNGEDAWVSIVCRTDGDWQRLCDIIDPALGKNPLFFKLADRKLNETALESLISDWTQARDRWEITEKLQAQNIAAFPSFTAEDIIHDPHLESRGFIERLEHPEVGVRAHTGIPWILTERPGNVRRPAPCIGQDTTRLLSEVIGYDADKIEELGRDNVLG